MRQTMALAQQSFIKSPHQLVCDLRIARGLAYYTGIVFETNLEGIKDFGSVASGGRYDNLVDRFGKYQLSGVGGSIGIDRLLAALEELGLATTAPSASVFVAIASDDALAYAWSLVTELRAAGIATDVATKLGKLGQQIKYADQRGIPIVLTVGGSEMQKQSVSAKIMSSGEQHPELPRGKMSEWVLARLADPK
jgi:histidyl-tRNA synthetase